MKIDMTRQLYDLDGEPIPGATLRQIVAGALLSDLRGDETLTGANKVDLHALAGRIHHEDAPDLKAEEIALIKERVGRGYAPRIVGPAWALLDPPAEPDGKPKG